MRSSLRRILIASAAGLAWASPASATFVNPIPEPIPQSSLTVGLAPFVTGLVAPNTYLPARDGTGRNFIVDQTGQILVERQGTVAPQPLLDLSSRMVALDPNYDERGLLGMALHPDFQSNGRFYTYHSAPLGGAADFATPGSAGVTMNHQSVVTEWRVDPASPDQVDPASGREVMRIDQPQANHNGGALAFGPDRNLYISLGDGGAADDQGPGHAPEGNGQNTQTVLGKILRINVDGTGAESANGEYNIPADNPFAAAGDGTLDEIYATGLRNPFRMSFTPDGRLVVGDVGQDNVEEVNVVTAGGNFGWRVKEGTFPFNPDAGEDGTSTVTVPGTPGFPAGLIDPALQYDKSDGNAVIAGFLYNGTLLSEEMVGQYIFGDLAGDFAAGPSGRLFIGNLETGEIFSLLDMNFFLKGFGEDENGELYALVSGLIGPSGTTGMILRLVGPQEVPEPAALGLLTLGVLTLVARRTRRTA